MELKTRRKPLAGQYLFYKKESIWYTLKLTPSDAYFINYEFIKDKNLYRLTIDTVKAKARIELIENKPNKEDYISKPDDINLDFFMTELVNNYMWNFRKISMRTRQEQESYENKKTLANSCVEIICDYLENKNDIQKAKEFISLRN